MERIKIRETNLDFGSLTNRATTDMIVLHHTGENDIDASAEQIHYWHLEQFSKIKTLIIYIPSRL